MQATEIEQDSPAVCYPIKDGCDFSRYFNNKQLSDVILVVGKHMLYTHKLLLVNVSDVFETMLTEVCVSFQICGAFLVITMLNTVKKM